VTDPSHVDGDGKARMVDVSAKQLSLRSATAESVVKLGEEAFSILRDNRAAKGDVLAVAKLAGIQAAKKASELIPLCHPLLLDRIEVEFVLNEADHSVLITASAACHGRTGVEMEALTAASVAALTIYDMLKAVQKDIEIRHTRLVAKSGGRSGEYVR
jgi:molybdenum cofactor biosynthesis protein MoaC